MKFGGCTLTRDQQVVTLTIVHPDAYAAMRLADMVERAVTAVIDSEQGGKVTINLPLPVGVTFERDPSSGDDTDGVIAVVGPSAPPAQITPVGNEE